MIIFNNDKILTKNKNYDFCENFFNSSLALKNGKILNSSKNLPDNWQNLSSWIDIELESEFENELISDAKFLTMREFLHEFDDKAMTIVSRAWQFRNWFKNIKFCSHCGSVLIPSETDYGRKCKDCGMTFYAPISPAVITAIENNGKLLLAHNTAWPEDRYSIIAGFVEPGERLEETVRREILEEVSVEVKNIKYFGSQTWPFPNSLMLGFTAEYEKGEIKPDGIEISKAGFYSPDEIIKMNLPNHESIARKLIDDFIKKFS